VWCDDPPEDRVISIVAGCLANHDRAHSHKDFWATTKVCVKVLLSAVKVLRFSDGMRGGNLGLMHNLLLQLDELYSSRIDGLPEKVRTKVSPRCIV
jgi:hypothetical protein